MVGDRHCRRHFIVMPEIPRTAKATTEAAGCGIFQNFPCISCRSIYPWQVQVNTFNLYMNNFSHYFNFFFTKNGFSLFYILVNYYGQNLISHYRSFHIKHLIYSLANFL